MFFYIRNKELYLHSKNGALERNHLRLRHLSTAHLEIVISDDIFQRDSRFLFAEPAVERGDKPSSGRCSASLSQGFVQSLIKGVIIRINRDCVSERS